MWRNPPSNLRPEDSLRDISPTILQLLHLNHPRDTLEVLHLDTSAIDQVPASEGLFSPRWSPDGRYIAALSLDQRQVRLLASPRSSGRRCRSIRVPILYDRADSRYLCRHESLDPAQPVDRISVPGGTVQQLIRLNDASRGDVQSYIFGGLRQDSEPLIVEQSFTGDMYTLDLK